MSPTVVWSMMASSWAAGTARSMAASAGSRARPMASAASARVSSSSARNSESTAAFLTSTSMPRGIGPTSVPLPGGRPPTMVVRTASFSRGRPGRAIGTLRRVSSAIGDPPEPVGGPAAREQSSGRGPLQGEALLRKKPAARAQSLNL